MPDPLAPPPLPKSQPLFSRRHNTILKLLGVGGMVLVLLVRMAKMERREVEETAIAQAYFLPEVLNVVGDIQTQKLHRGIYEAVVFRAQITLSGRRFPFLK